MVATILPVSHHEQQSENNTVFGFWLYLMTDCILFAALFATYAVLMNNTAGGPTSQLVFNDLSYVLVETACLLLSSLTCGLAMLSAHQKQHFKTQIWLLFTLLLGALFVGLEINEFYHLISEDSGPSRSGFLSAFFALVGLHGLHVTVGVIWLVLLIIQVKTIGFTSKVRVRLTCFSLFWHFLDIIWIAVFTLVYLRGAMG